MTDYKSLFVKKLNSHNALQASIATKSDGRWDYFSKKSIKFFNY